MYITINGAVMTSSQCRELENLVASRAAEWRNVKNRADTRDTLNQVAYFQYVDEKIKEFEEILEYLHRRPKAKNENP